MSKTLVDDLPSDILYEISINFSLTELVHFFEALHAPDAKHLIKSLSFWFHYLKHCYQYEIGMDICKIIAQNLVSKYEKWLITIAKTKGSIALKIANEPIYLIHDLEERIMFLPDIILFISKMVKHKVKHKVKTRGDLIPLIDIKKSIDVDKRQEFVNENIHRKMDPSMALDYIVQLDTITYGKLSAILKYVGWIALDPYYNDTDKWLNASIKLDHDNIQRALRRYLIPGNRKWPVCFFR